MNNEIITPQTLCTPLAVEMINNNILKIFIGFFFENKPMIAFVDHQKKILEIKPKEMSLMSSAVSKKKFLLLDKNLSKKEQFEFKDFTSQLEKLEDQILQTIQ